MNTRDYLMDEFKRLNRRNDLLEKTANQSMTVSVAIEETMQKNTLAMCEIAKVL